ESVPRPVYELGQPAGQDHQQDEQTDPGGEQRIPAGQQVLDAVDVEGAEDRAGYRTQASDHDHGEEREALVGAEGAEVVVALQDHEHATRQPGYGPRDGKGDQVQLDRAEPDRLGGQPVVLGG